MIDIKPKVVQDFAAINEKFPCNVITQRGLEQFVNIHSFYRLKYYSNRLILSFFCYLEVFALEKLNAEKSKIDACMIKTAFWKDITTYYQDLESFLATRLSDETFRGILNFEASAFSERKSIAEIEQALVS